VVVRGEETRRPSLEEQGFGVPQARARREAERNLLALLLAHPEIGDARIRFDDGSSLPLTEAITPEVFLDPDCREVLDAIHVWLEDRHRFTIDEVLAEVRSATCKAVAADLVLAGERRASSENIAREQVQDAVDAFERIRRTRSAVLASSGLANSSPARTSDEPDALAARLEAIRSRGRDPTAFGRLPGSPGTRTNAPPAD
jgi:hypothetical protein